jgi:hypothetical protein
MTTLSQLAQLELELINRARMDPAAEAQRAGLSDLNWLVSTTSSGFPITADPKQVLAGNNQLTAAATGHTAQMIAKNSVSHSGIGDFDPATRIANAGYTGNTVLRPENIGNANGNAFNSNPAALPTERQLSQQLAEANHLGLFKDDPANTFGDEKAGHRLTMLDPNYKEVGIGATAVTTTTANSIDVKFFMTENFGSRGTQSFLTGAVYNDNVIKDNFYSLGEAVKGVTATVRNAAGVVIGSDTTGDGGGWSVGEPGGTYKVTFSGAGKGDISATIDAGSLNAKMDLVNGNEIYANANTTLNEGAVGLRLIGIQNINGTGNAGNNVITGNAGANILTGSGGNDTIDGLGGNDTAVFTGKQSDYKIVINGNTATIEDLRAGSPDGIDTITNIELVKFADVTVAYSALKNQIPPAPVAGSVSISDATIVEGDAGTKVMTFKVTRSGGTAAFDVNFTTADGTAKVSDGDYVAANGPIHFNANDTEKLISVTINGDARFEGDEAFNVNLLNPTNGATIVRGTAAGTIQNDDAAPAVAGSVVISDAIITEGDAGTKVMTFKVTRSGGTAAFDVNFATADGTAKVSDSDYVAAAGPIHFNANETEKLVSVTVNGDARFESDETFNVNLSNATNGAKIADGTALGTIQNDDVNHAPTVTGKNVTVAAGGSIAAGSIFTGQDLDGNSTITKYAFWDAGKGGGFFTVNGVAQAPGAWIEVNASDLGNVKYVGSVNGGAESIYAKVFDGNVWSSFVQVNATTLQHAPEDFNNDGATDILFHNIKTGAVAMWQMDSLKILANEGVSTQATTWHAMDAFDFNGDGKADILWENSNGQLQLWQMDGSKVAQKLDLGSLAAGWHVGGVDDFNGDGKADVLVFSDKGQLQMWNMNGASHTTTDVGTIAAGWTIQDTADFNGDGKADLLVRNGSSVSMWQMDGATVTKQSNYTMGDAFHFAGTGDFNGDGKADILWHNPTNNQVVLWEMDGANILSNTTVGFTAAGWEVANVGDFNHDGHADILLRDTTGRVAEWQMDGDHIVTNQVFGSTAADWHVI